MNYRSDGTNVELSIFNLIGPILKESFAKSVWFSCSTIFVIKIKGVFEMIFRNSKVLG